jgi:hypothetical protein
MIGPRIAKLLEAVEQALGNDTPPEGEYQPLFIMLPLQDGDRWQFFGWHGDALQVDPKLGHTLIGWIKSKPPYNTAFISESIGYWCVCVQRQPSDHEIMSRPEFLQVVARMDRSGQPDLMTTSDVAIPEEPKKDCPF